MVGRVGAVFVLVACGPAAAPPEAADVSGSSGATTTVGAETTSSSPTATSDASASDTTAEGSSSTGAPEPPREDLGDAAYDCDPFLQDCPAGYKCLPWSNDGGLSLDATWCRPVVRDGKPAGEPCLAEGSHQAYQGDDCDESSMCWFVDWSTGEGICVPFCLGTPEDPACADACRTCVQDSFHNTNLCVEQCDPLAQDCPSGETCLPNPWHHGFACAPALEATRGEPCRFLDACEVGLVCVDATGTPATGRDGLTCRALCAIGDACTDPELDCVPLNWPSACRAEGIGVCLP